MGKAKWWEAFSIVPLSSGSLSWLLAIHIHPPSSYIPIHLASSAGCWASPSISYLWCNLHRLVSFCWPYLCCIFNYSLVFVWACQFELHSQKLFAGSYCGCATVKLEMRNCKLGRAAGDLSEKWEKKSQKRGELLKYIKVMLWRAGSSAQSFKKCRLQWDLNLTFWEARRAAFFCREPALDLKVQPRKMWFAWEAIFFFFCFRIA